MFLKFTIKNFLSFKNETVINMLADKDKQFLNSNTFKLDDDNNVLKSVLIYGSNASGKSNLIRAISFFKYFIINSSKETQQKEEIPVDCFKLNEGTLKEPSLFEIVFLSKNIRYRYGFEITRKKIINEWLFASYSNKESKLFIREGEKIDIGSKFKEGKDLEDKTRENALFLSVVAQFNGTISKEILDWLSGMHIILSGDRLVPPVTVNILENKFGIKKKKKLLNFLKFADFNIEDFKVASKEIKNNDFFKNLPFTITFKEDAKKGINKKKIEVFPIRNIKTKHKLYSENHKDFSFTEFDLEREESSGTKRFFDLAGPIIDTLVEGNILFIDEIESSMHPLLVFAIVKMINSKINNPKNAQFFFTTHNISILSKSFLRRDQLLFLDKNKYGETELFSLSDFKGIRKDASYEKDYLMGKYGAVPILKSIDNNFLGN